MDDTGRQLVRVYAAKTAEKKRFCVFTVILTKEGRVFVDYSDIAAFLAVNGCPDKTSIKLNEKMDEIVTDIMRRQQAPPAAADFFRGII